MEVESGGASGAESSSLGPNNEAAAEDDTSKIDPLKWMVQEVFDFFKNLLFRLRRRLSDPGDRRPGVDAAEGGPLDDRHGYEAGAGAQNCGEDRRYASGQGR